jgi:hypothetical protein
MIRAMRDQTEPRAELSESLDWLLAIVLAGYLFWCTSPHRLAIAGTKQPFDELLMAGVVAGLVVAALRRVRIEPLTIIVLMVCVASLLTDFLYSGIRFSDLGIYLAAGRHWLGDQQVYQLSPLVVMPKDGSALPFLYPPSTLPLFGFLAILPAHLGGITFIGGSIGAFLLGARRVGLSWRWSVAALAWPPVFVGLVSGNIAVALFALFALAPSIGSVLIVAPLFKVYNALAALWLIRERQVRSIIVGSAVVLGLCALTLPFVGGLMAWRDWIEALRAFAASEQAIPAFLGLSLERYMPFVLAVAIGGLVTVAGLRASGRIGLARLGIATIAVQPSLYLHGFIVSLPALLSLRARWFWLAAAALSVTTGPRGTPAGLAWPGPWIAIAIVVASWAVPGLLRDPAGPTDPLHPLGRSGALWPRESGQLAARWQSRASGALDVTAPVADSAGTGGGHPSNPANGPVRAVRRRCSVDPGYVSNRYYDVPDLAVPAAIAVPLVRPIAPLDSAIRVGLPRTRDASAAIEH